ncbi:MAG: guanylate kinase [Chthonomonadaceae bacterium]|nr:guanylate kinase [Chthonomonadaceae bacterium]
MSGKLVILSGPSGVGKDTVLDAWRGIDPRVVRVVAYTTRAPREGEVDGVDYHFVTERAFMERAMRGAFLEWMEVHGKHYATPLEDMEALLADGKTAVLKIDVQGALRVMELRPGVLSIMLVPPSWEALEQRMRDRGTESPEALALRLENARKELALADRYTHQVVNDDVARAVREIQGLVLEATA